MHVLTKQAKEKEKETETEKKKKKKKKRKNGVNRWPSDWRPSLYSGGTREWQPFIRAQV